jgi:hypothetical protein
MPFSGDTFTKLYNWLTDPQRNEKIYNSRLDDEFGGIATGLTTVATDITSLENRLEWTLAVITATDAAWAVPAGTVEMIIEGWGGGGSGAGGDDSGTSQRGSGGGAGGYFYKHYKGTIDSTLAVTIGAGGTGVTSTSGGANGNHGNATTVVGANLGTLTANRGDRGLAGVNSGGAGGTGTNGDINIQGEGGQTSWSAASLVAVFRGGCSPRGGMGGSQNVGSAGGIPGGGGACGNHTAATDSGAGARGQVHIWTR